jgi:two-component system, LytTR family, sensor kinase
MLSMQLPQYTKKDLQILAVTMPLIVLLINYLLFDNRIFREPVLLLKSGLIILAVMLPVWFCFTWIAVTARNRLPAGKETVKRLVITVSMIAFIQALVMTLFFRGYSHFKLFGYELNESRYYWTLAIGFLLNILVTLLHEGFERFENWKTTLTETEQLKTAYTQSQLLGLKSQVNPHFLFNSLNTLSSLISEDEDKAEKFLNELTKVYRYLLRSPDERLVTLETEIHFIRSYYHLLKERYGDRIDLRIDINEDQYNKYVSPLLLQTVFEYSLNSNTLLKENPLRFLVGTDNEGRLIIENNVQEKQTAVQVSTDAIRNLVEKYKLLCAESVEISKKDNVFRITIPLISEYSNISV